MKNIVKTVTHLFKTFGNWIIDHLQGITYTLLILVVSGFYVYTLGYSTNWATIVSETRASNFYFASQQANKLISQLGFIAVIVMLFVIFTQTHKRRTFYMSNIVLSIFSSILLIVNAALTLYYNSVLGPMYRAITELEVPPHLYTIRRTSKSFFVFEFGNLYAVIMILVAIWVLVFVGYKMKVQKDRKLQIAKAVESYER